MTGERSPGRTAAQIPLGVAWVAGMVALLCFAGSWAGFALDWAPVDTFDTTSLEVFHRIGVAHPAWVRFWDLLCTVAGPLTFRVLTLVAIVVALVRSRPRTAVFLALTVECAGLVTEALKWAADRDRPATALVHGAGSSFPSGHALGVMAAVLALAAAARPWLGPRSRVALTLVGTVVVVVVGVGRVVLNVHHPTDVLAGWAAGYLWFGLWLMLCPPGPGPLSLGSRGGRPSLRSRGGTPPLRSRGGTPPGPGSAPGSSPWRS